MVEPGGVAGAGLHARAGGVTGDANSIEVSIPFRFEARLYDAETVGHGLNHQGDHLQSLDPARRAHPHQVPCPR
jgi:hypothetical protein